MSAQESFALDVEPFEIGRFLVASSSRKIKHLVDLNHEGHPACSCEDYEFHSKDQPDFRCKHISAVLAAAAQKAKRIAA